MHKFMTECRVAEPIIAPCYLDEVLTVMEKFLPTADSLLELDRKSVEDCLIFVCDFTWHYFTAVGSNLRLRSASSLMMELFRLDALYEFDVSVAGRLKAAWQQGLAVAYRAGDPESGKYVDEMLATVVASVGECGQVYRLSEIVSGLWHTAVVASSQPLDLSVIKQALSLSSSALMRSASMLALVLDHSLFLHSVDGFQPSTAAASLLDARGVALAALTARFLLASWKNVPLSACHTEDADDEDDDDDNLSVAKSDTGEETNSLNLEMLGDIAVAIVCIQATQAYTGRPPLLHQELQQDFRQLIGRLSNVEAESLVSRTMEQSLASGEVWSLALDVILRQLELCNEDVVNRSLPTDADQFVPLTLSAVSTLCVILPRMSRDTQQYVTEITVALLLTCDVDRIAAFDCEYAYVMKVTFSS